MANSISERAVLQAEARRVSRKAAWSGFFAAMLLVFPVAIRFVDTLAERHYTGPDGISYLDMAEAMARGNWSAAVNAYWSPLYPFLISIALRILRPSAYWEFATVNLVNLLTYVGVVISFSYFMKAFVAYIARIEEEAHISFPISTEAWTILGYTLFIWASAQLVNVREAISPDMCLSIFIYLAAAIVLRIRTNGGSWLTYSLLGIALGLGFYAKVPMFPLAFVFLLVSVFAAGEWRKGLKGAIVAGIVFLAISSPLIYGLSRSKGHLTFGDSGSLNFCFYVNNLPKYYWQPPAAASQSSLHYPAEELFAHPAAYVFTIPLQGTYPYWYDPTLWYGNVRPRYDLAEMVPAFKANLRFYARVLLRREPAIPLAIFLLFIFRSRRASIPLDLARQWVLLAVPVAGLLMFSLVHAEPRYVSPYIALLLVGIFAGVCLPDSPKAHRAFTYIIFGLALFMVLHLSFLRAGEVRSLHLQEFAAGSGNAENFSWEVSNALKDAGLQPGDKIAWIRPKSFTTKDNYWWARLAKLQIIAEIPNLNGEFWAVDDSSRAAAVQSLAQTGAKAVVVSDVPASARLQDFVALGSTGYYVHFYR